VSRTDVKSDQPKDTVIGMSPGPGTFQPPNTTVNLTVSKGPTTSTVPDVTSQSQTDAQAQLKASGFGVRIVPQPVTDSNQDGIVQTQDPPGGVQAPPGTVVTIAVGKFSSTTTPGPP
jgi:serine/threonine-protein kinase